MAEIQIHALRASTNELKEHTYYNDYHCSEQNLLKMRNN
jgi:hypothetical protein